MARGRAYAAAGADVVFVESPESEDEFARVADSIDAPVLANMVEGGFSPVLAADRLAELGFTIGLFPVTGLLAATARLQAVYDDLRRTGTSPGVENGVLPISTMHDVMGMNDVQSFDARWAD
ncbi:MAG: isocitrate lyase/phosphoenolpyruvate mutase family protein [Actinomycetota bacterium]